MRCGCRPQLFASIRGMWGCRRWRGDGGWLVAGASCRGMSPLAGRRGMSPLARRRWRVGGGGSCPNRDRQGAARCSVPGRPAQARTGGWPPGGRPAGCGDGHAAVGRWVVRPGAAPFRSRFGRIRAGSGTVLRPALRSAGHDVWLAHWWASGGLRPRCRSPGTAGFQPAAPSHPARQRRFRSSARQRRHPASATADIPRRRGSGDIPRGGASRHIPRRRESADIADTP
jgi:hypothetical protein